MQLGSPLNAISAAIGAALHRDLPDIEYQDRDWEQYKKGVDVRVTKTRRPSEYDIEVVVFPQTWGSTALGYGGIGGAAMTPAYTIIVTSGYTSCVYFGGSRLAYKIDLSRLSHGGMQRWLRDIAGHAMVECTASRKEYDYRPETKD